MKKVFFTTAFLFVAAIAGINAQTKTSFGVKLGGNMNNVKLTDLKGSSGSFQPGASVGGFATIEFSEHFALQPELVFNYTESSVKQAGEKTRFKYAGVEIPVYAVGQYQAGNGKVFIGAGPRVGYGFSADSATEKLPSGAAGENKIELDHWYTGGGVMAGYKWNMGISVQAGYQLGFDISSKSSGVKTQAISLGIGYTF